MKLAFSILIMLLGTQGYTSPNDYFVDITDSNVLESLDKQGLYSFATHIGYAEREKIFREQNSADPMMSKLDLLRLSQLKDSNWYSKIEKSIVGDIEEFIKNSGVKSTYSVTTLNEEDSERPRYFDYMWLRSKSAAFKLVAVVNRMDRKDFVSDSCGELRFIYRLGYSFASKKSNANSEQFSMLPVFLNFVFKYKNPGSCSAIANSWNMNKTLGDNEAFLKALQDGPLNKDSIVFKQIELNMQIVRFSSGDKRDFGGSAVYLLRIFEPNDEGDLVEKPLENTPDVTAILKNPSLKKSLVDQLTDPKNLRSIDQGTFQLENTEHKLLAKKALSYSTTGHARLGNKPFSFLFLTGLKNPDLEKRFDPKDFKALNSVSYSEAELIKGPLGLIERMDSMSCMGCHQTNATAGFHILGRYYNMDTKTNRTALAFSPHSYSERIRRSSYIDALAKNQEPNTFRPLPSFPDADWSVLSPGTHLPTFSSAQTKELCLEPTDQLSKGIPCRDPENYCLVNAENKRLGIQYGECVFKKESPKIYGGLSCRQGVIDNALDQDKAKTSGLPFNFFSFRDVLNGLDGTSLPTEIYKIPAPHYCGKPSGGIPMGRVSMVCENNSPEARLEFVDKIIENKFLPNSRLNLPSQICALRGGSQFDVCAKTDKVLECLSKADVRRAFLDLCYQGRFCREDYVCQQLPAELISQYTDPATKASVEKRILELNRRNIGFCVPTYFVFNMRIDGHPLPEGRK